MPSTRRPVPCWSRGAPLVVDLSGCEYLDSTFLGTVHELVARGNVAVTGVTPAVRALFEELSMEQVLAAIRERHSPRARALRAEHGGATPRRGASRILHAHEALSGLSDRNRAEFREVVESLRGNEAGSERPNRRPK